MAKTVSALLFMVPPLFGTALSAWKILHKYLNEIFEWKKEGLFLYSNNLLFTCLRLTPFICCFLLPFCFSLLPESLRSFPPYQISLLAPHCLWSPLLTPRLQLLPTGSLFMFLSLNCLEEKKLWVVQLILSGEVIGLVLWWIVNLWTSCLRGGCPVNPPALCSQSPGTYGSRALEVWLMPCVYILIKSNMVLKPTLFV